MKFLQQGSFITRPIKRFNQDSDWMFVRQIIPDSSSERVISIVINVYIYQ